MGRALNHHTPSYQGSLRQACKLPPVPTRKTAVGSYVASFFYACPLSHCHFSTRSQRELLRCNQVLTSTFIKALSPGLFPPPTDGFLLHLQQNPYPGLHDPVKSIFLFLKKTRVATGPGLSVLPAPLSQIPALSRAKCFSPVSFQLNYHLLT